MKLFESAIETGEYPLPENRFGFLAIEKHRPDLAVLPEKTIEIIDGDTAHIDGAVQAAWADTALQHIP